MSKCGHTLNYHHFTYANLGDYYCQSCGFKRPELDYKVTGVQELNVTHSTFKLDNDLYTLHNAGVYNIYNALAAYTASADFSMSHRLILKMHSLRTNAFSAVRKSLSHTIRKSS